MRKVWKKWPTFPCCGHILHWYFLPVDPFDGCEWRCPPLLFPTAAWFPLFPPLTGCGTTKPVWPDPDWLVAGGDEEAEELLRWPYKPADICCPSKPRSSRPETARNPELIKGDNRLIKGDDRLIEVGNCLIKVSNCFIKGW